MKYTTMQEALRAKHTYDESTGHLISNSGRKKGKITGTVQRTSAGNVYRVLKVNYTAITEGAAVWTYHNGPVPKSHCVCYKDKNSLNTRIENLYIKHRIELIDQAAKSSYSHRTHRERVGKGKKKTPRGISFTGDNKFTARITFNGLPVCLGTFDTVEEALETLNAAKERLAEIDNDHHNRNPNNSKSRSLHIP